MKVVYFFNFTDLCMTSFTTTTHPHEKRIYSNNYFSYNKNLYCFLNFQSYMRCLDESIYSERDGDRFRET